MDTFAIDPDKRIDVPTGLRRSGITGGNGIFDKYFNQIIFELRQDHIWGTQAQVLLGDATFYTAGSGDALDASDSVVNFSDDDKILIARNTPMDKVLKFQPSSSKRLNIEMMKGVELDFGDSGAGAPWRIRFESNFKEGSKIKIRGTFDFKKSTISREDKRLIVNHAKGVEIYYNEYGIYVPSNTGELFYADSVRPNPYEIEYNGQTLDWKLDSGVTNFNETYFRDLNIFGSGLVFDGTDFVETNSRHTLPSTIASNPHLFQINKGYGFLRQRSDSDQDINARLDRNGVSVFVNADFVISTSKVIFDSSTDIKNGMRINNTGVRVPESTTGTTIITNLNLNDSGDITADMVDGLDGVTPVLASSSGSAIGVKLDNSGAAGGSEQENQMQGFKISVLQVSSPLTEWFSTGTGINWGRFSDDKFPIDDGTNGTPRIGIQTYPDSILGNLYQRP